MAVEHRFHTAGTHIAEDYGLHELDRHKFNCGPGEDGLVLFLLTGASGAGKSSAARLDADGRDLLLDR
jgi:adenylylsulfate kinase-like enzyme